MEDAGTTSVAAPRADAPVAIKLSGVGVQFAINRQKKGKLRSLLRGARKETFWALRDLDIEIRAGESVGLIGSNGSGKSTMLKLIAGVMYPDEGTVEVHGGIAPLIELGAGFSPELSARENVYLSGMILGLTEREIDQKFEDIVAFSGVRKFLDTPLKHYSSGMKARLGFSIVAQIDYPIMLIDEVLAVGDRRFRLKCNAVLERKLGQGGRTLVLVSHREADIRKFCTRVIYLREGKVLGDGPPDEVFPLYNGEFEG